MASGPTRGRRLLALTGIQNISFAPSSRVAQSTLASLQRLVPVRTVSLSAIQSTLHHPNNDRLRVARRRHTAQDPPDSLSLVTDFPIILSRLLANVRASVPCSLFSSLTDGLAPFRVSCYMNLGRLSCRSQWQRHCAIRSCSSSTRS